MKVSFRHVGFDGYRGRHAARSLPFRLAGDAAKAWSRLVLRWGGVR
jgi:hypothetical protein